MPVLPAHHIARQPTSSDQPRTLRELARSPLFPTIQRLVRLIVNRAARTLPAHPVDVDEAIQNASLFFLQRSDLSVVPRRWPHLWARKAIVRLRKAADLHERELRTLCSASFELACIRHDSHDLPNAADIDWFEEWFFDQYKDDAAWLYPLVKSMILLKPSMRRALIRRDDRAQSISLVCGLNADKFNPNAHADSLSDNPSNHSEILQWHMNAFERSLNSASTRSGYSHSDIIILAALAKSRLLLECSRTDPDLESLEALTLCRTLSADRSLTAKSSLAESVLRRLGFPVRRVRELIPYSQAGVRRSRSYQRLRFASFAYHFTEPIGRHALCSVIMTLYNQIAEESARKYRTPIA